MLKKTITYTDYNDVTRTEDFYFNLSEAEVLDMELSTTGGFSEYLKRIVDAQDAPTLMKLFKEIIAKSYGEKSDDGKRFIKSEEISNAFMQTEAYNKLFVELLTDAKKASDFANAIAPKPKEEAKISIVDNK